MRTRAGVTAGVAVLSVFASAVGHAVVAGHPVPGSAVPRLGLLAALCFLLASQRLARPVLIAALSLIQVAVHLTLATAHAAMNLTLTGATTGQSEHHGHDMAAMSDMASSAGMSSTGMGDMAGMGGMPAVPGPVRQTGFDVPMVALHLAAMLATLALLHGAAAWWERLVVALARVLPRLPRVPVGFVRPVGAAYAVVATPCPQRWLPATVRRRGPPAS